MEPVLTPAVQYLSPTIQYIKAEMKRQNMSMPTLADKINKPHSTVWRILSGKSLPMIDTVEQMFAALGLPPIGPKK